MEGVAEVVVAEANVPVDVSQALKTVKKFDTCAELLAGLFFCTVHTVLYLCLKYIGTVPNYLGIPTEPIALCRYLMKFYITGTGTNLVNN